MNKVIFLDFDGVLHCSMNGDFEFLPNLYKVLDTFPELKIVISSDWREGINEQSYQDIFGSYNSRILGITSKLPGFKREDEILEYANKHNITSFIAVDDDCRDELFSPDCNWLFKTSYFAGLNEAATYELIKFIENRF